MKLFWLILLTLSGQISLSQKVAFVLHEKDLIPECITWSKKERCFYLTSIYKSKIIKYDPATGETMDFVQPGQDGFNRGIGLIVDDKRRRLWSLCGENAGKEYITGIFAWDLGSGKLIHRYMVKDSIPRLFNDLALDKDGNVYVTDTYLSKIFFFNTRLDEPEVFLEDISYPNGISIGPGQTLFIASHTKGVLHVDIPSKVITCLEHPELTHTTQGMDGLKYHRGSLVAVHNGPMDSTQHKVLQFHLKDRNKRISSVETLDANNPQFVIPTTGVVVRNKYYLIANSNLSLLDQRNYTIPDRSKLKETVVLEYRL